MNSDRLSVQAFASDQCRFSHRRFRWIFLFVSLLACLALFPPASFPGDKKAQDKNAGKLDHALIFGTVWSANDHPAAGVKVNIRRSDDKKKRWTLVSDRRGEFAQRVPTGSADYVVWAELPKQKEPAAQTTVHIESNERADIGLHLKQ